MRFNNQSSRGTTVPTEPQQEALMSMLGKITLVWTGFFAGVSLKDALQVAVLLATLVYTVIQIWILFRDKILRDKVKKAQIRQDIADYSQEQ
jgi:hypothetical protein